MSEFATFICRGDAVKIKEYLDDSANEIVDREKFLNKRDSCGKSALDLAAMLGREDVIKVLLECGANPNSSTKRGYTVLHQAASWGHLDCVKLLVSHGTDIQTQNIYGERARETAARYGNSDCVEFLDRAEAVTALRNAVENVKSIITDPDKNLGRLNKEDKVTGNKLCDEKNNWLIANKDTASVEMIFKKKDELLEALHYVFLKLEDVDSEKKR